MISNADFKTSDLRGEPFAAANAASAAAKATQRVEPTGTIHTAQAAAETAAAASTANAVKSSTKVKSPSSVKESFSAAGSSLKEGGAALLDKVKAWTGVGANGAKDAAGGIGSFLKGTAEFTAKAAAGTAGFVGKTAKAFPGTTIVVAAVAGYMGIRAHQEKRAKQQELDQTKNMNELLATKASNDALEAQMGGGAKPQFDNPDARNDFAQKYGARTTAPASSAAR